MHLGWAIGQIKYDEACRDSHGREVCAVLLERLGVDTLDLYYQQRLDKKHAHHRHRGRNGGAALTCTLDDVMLLGFWSALEVCQHRGHAATRNPPHKDVCGAGAAAAQRRLSSPCPANAALCLRSCVFRGTCSCDSRRLFLCRSW